jgi:hypothetical protein
MATKTSISRNLSISTSQSETLANGKQTKKKPFDACRCWFVLKPSLIVSAQSIRGLNTYAAILGMACRLVSPQCMEWLNSAQK